MRVIVLVASFVLAFPLVVSAQEEGAQKETQTTQANEQQRRSEPLAVTITGPIAIDREKTVEPEWDQPNCKKPGGHDEADLCQQRRMAKAADKTVLLNAFQVGMGLLTLIGLGFTVFYTRSTAKAAIVAADAARDSADALPRLERAYIFLHLQCGGTGASSVLWHFSFKNQGKTPAVIRGLDIRVDVLENAPDNLEFIPNKHAIVYADQTVLAADDVLGTYSQKCSFDEAGRQALIDGTKLAWFYGSLAYVDVFGREHFTRFRWALHDWKGTNRPTAVGGPPYNERT